MSATRHEARRSLWNQYFTWHALPLQCRRFTCCARLRAMPRACELICGLRRVITRQVACGDLTRAGQVRSERSIAAGPPATTASLALPIPLHTHDGTHDPTGCACAIPSRGVRICEECQVPRFAIGSRALRHRRVARQRRLISHDQRTAWALRHPRIRHLRDALLPARTRRVADSCAQGEATPCIGQEGPCCHEDGA